MNLQAIPVFGFETQKTCFYQQDDNCKGYAYICRNLLKGLSVIPIINIVAAIVFFTMGIDYIQEGAYAENESVDNPKLKGAALITRGVVTLLGGGILFVLADIVTTIGRAALKKESAEVLQ